MKKGPYIFLISLIAIGCSTPEYRNVDELSKYIIDPDNGLIQKSESNGYVFEVVYRPTDLLVNQQETVKSMSAGKLDTLRKKYNNYYYFVLNLSKNKREALQPSAGMDQYSNLVQTLSFTMGSFVNLTTSVRDTIPTADFILNRTYGLSNATSLLFVFNKEKAKDKEWVQFNLNEFGLGTGNQRFRFKVKDLENVPSLKSPIPKPEKLAQ